MPDRCVFDGRVIFDHLPKTAGQAINAWLVSALGAANVTPNLVGQHRDLIRLYGGEYSVISGHIFFEGEGLDPRYRYVTCFREPIDRTISWIFFILKNHQRGQLKKDLWTPAERFLASDGEELDSFFRKSISNPYVEHFVKAFGTPGGTDDEKLAQALEIIESYDVWGLYKQMSLFVADFAGLIGLPPPNEIARVNVTRERPAVNQISDALRSKLIALNSLDLRLYAELKKRYQEKRGFWAENRQLPRQTWLPYEKVKDREYFFPGIELVNVAPSDLIVVSRGETVSIDIDISLSKCIHDLEIGIYITDSNRYRVFGVDSASLSHVLKNQPPGVYRFSFYFLANLPAGLYSIGFSVTENEGEDFGVLACQNQICEVRVDSERKYSGGGYVDLPVQFAMCSLAPEPTRLVSDAKGRLSLSSGITPCISGQEYLLDVELFNLSEQTWYSTRKNPINMSYHWLGAEGNVLVFEGARTPLSVLRVMPGDMISLTMKVAAPPVPGRYRLHLLPVQEGHCWFDELGFEPELLEVDVLLSAEGVRFSGNHCALKSQIGYRSSVSLGSSGAAGFLLYGPYLTLPAGKYRAVFSGAATVGTAAFADVSADQGRVVLGHTFLSSFDQSGVIAEIYFELQKAVSDLETRLWIDAADYVFLDSVSIEPIRACGELAGSLYSGPEYSRVSLTVSCADCSPIPKVDGAGSVFDTGGQRVQLMHEGSVVVAGGYFGSWMQEIICRLQGHHEPQEERFFYALLQHARPASLRVEIGCYWAYYSNWFVGAIPQGRAICIEPDELRLSVGMQNFALNNRRADFYVAAAGGKFEAETSFLRESDGKLVNIPVWDFERLLAQIQDDTIEILHMDVQGAELPFLKSIEATDFKDRIRFLVISTHHQCISGSTTTHRDCLATLINLGAVILCEHSVDESFSGDGLIVASFFEKDAGLSWPNISRCNPQLSSFGPDPERAIAQGGDFFRSLGKPLSLGEIPLLVEWVQANDGPMCVFGADSVIGRALKTQGSFGTEKIDEVLDFLVRGFSFVPQQFVDIGANIGTHLIHALKKLGFEKGVAFEPDPYNYALLAQNVMANGLQACVTIFKMALSSESGVANFELCSENFGDHRVRVSDVQTDHYFGENGRRLISVLKDTGDEIFREHALTLNSRTLIWMDTQGHEGEVFKGFKRLFASENKPFLVCEFWPYGLERANGKEAFFDFLKKCSSIYDINQPGWQNAQPLILSELDRIYEQMLDETRSDYYPHTDLLCIF